MSGKKSRRELQQAGTTQLGASAPGILYIVATPIGNLEDMTFRAVRILGDVDLIAAEDTRHSRKLLSHFNIATPLTSCFEHNEKIKSRFLLEKLLSGASIALITDAGTPCISDPGYRLVAEAVAAGITVAPIPGPCAAVAALSAAGLPTDSFLFAGFLPPRQAKRRSRLAELAAAEHVIVLYEAPQRLIEALHDVRAVLGDRTVVVARELSKVYEEFVRGPVSEVARLISERPPKGEIVVMVGPAEGPSSHDVPVEESLERALRTGKVTMKEAVAHVAAETGIPRRKVYAAALEVSRRLAGLEVDG